MDPCNRYASLLVTASLFLSPTIAFGATATDTITIRSSAASMSECIDTPRSCLNGEGKFVRLLQEDLNADLWDGLELALPDGAEDDGLVLAGTDEEADFPELEMASPDSDEYMSENLVIE